MLQAFKNDTQMELQVKSLGIREKELNYWNMCLSTMARQGALIAGFTYFSMVSGVPASSSPLLQFLSLVLTILGMSCSLLTVTISAFCTMFGPGLALRGPEGAESMHKAVDIMQEYAHSSFSVFMLGLICFHVSGILMMWKGGNVMISVVTSIVLVGFLVAFFVMGAKIYPKLYVHSEKAVSGRFHNFEGYEDMPALDSRSRALPVSSAPVPTPPPAKGGIFGFFV